jgi:hypothetical protein
MVLLVAPFLETHVFVITTLAIYLWLYHKNHSMTITHHTRLLQLYEYMITKKIRPRRVRVSSRFPTL